MSMKSFSVLRGVIIAVVLACLAGMTAAAATDREVLAFGEPQSSVSLSTENIWRLVLEQPGSLRISLTADIGVAVALRDSDGTWLDGSILAAGAAFNRNIAGENLAAGAYYLEIAPSTPGEEGTYELTAYFTASAPGTGTPERPGDSTPSRDPADMLAMLQDRDILGILEVMLDMDRLDILEVVGMDRRDVLDMLDYVVMDMPYMLEMEMRQIRNMDIREMLDRLDRLRWLDMAFMTDMLAMMGIDMDMLDTLDMDAPDMLAMLLTLHWIVDWVLGMEEDDWQPGGNVETPPPALRLEDIIVGEWRFARVDETGFASGTEFRGGFRVFTGGDASGVHEFRPDGTFTTTFGNGTSVSGTYAIGGSILTRVVSGQPDLLISMATIINNDTITLTGSLYYLERIAPAETEEPAVDTPATQEPAAPPTGVPTLPQTGVRNIAPLLAIIGIAGGFLLIISKELILLCQKRVRRRFMSVTYAGILIILSSATVYGLDFYEDFTRHSNNMRVNEIMRGQMAERMAETQEDRAEETAEIPECGERPEYACAEPGLIEIDGELYLGILKIPALNLELPVNNEWSYERLEVSPCRFAGDFTGGLIICAHNYRVHFANLSRLAPGDEIIITDAAGREHIYIVKLTEIIAGTDISGMVDTPFELTLFTCTPDGRDRITVRSMRAPG